MAVPGFLSACHYLKLFEAIYCGINALMGFYYKHKLMEAEINTDVGLPQAASSFKYSRIKYFNLRSYDFLSFSDAH